MTDHDQKRYESLTRQAYAGSAEVDTQQSELLTQALRDEIQKLRAELKAARDALEKIADPRKRDHKEPDAYTELGCVMHIANEALKALEGRKGREG